MSRRRLLLMLLTALMLALPGCGGGEGRRKGGELRVLGAADFQHLDPGESYYQFDYMVIYATQRPLYSWRPDRIDRPTPDLATGQPQVSGDGKTVIVRIKNGVRFSPPVNREVTSRDVKYAIERGVLPSVANAYVSTYFSLAGFKEFQDKKAKGIAGIQTPDDRTIVFRLTRPTGVIAVPGGLSLPLTAPVPEEYARKFDRQSSSTYGEHEVATGPYMLENDSSGNVTGYQAGKRAVLVRNPNWDRSTDYRPAYLDRIEFDLGNDVNVASRRILAGRHLVSGDFVPPPSILKQALESRKDQVALTASESNRFIAMNTTIPPLNDVNVRRAIVAGMDRNALRLVEGGAAAGDIATHFIPPGVPGFEDAGGFGTKFDFLKNPHGNRGLAASYFEKAGYASGRNEGNRKLLMVGVTDKPDKELAEAAASQLERLGFKIELREVSSDTMYSKFCNVPKVKVAFCPDVGWRGDFNDPQTYLDLPFNGKKILPANNSNWPQLDDPAVNAAMKRDAEIINPAGRAKAWADVDMMVTALAPAVPWLWPNQAALRSADVRGVVSRFVVLWDLSFTSLK